MVFQFTYRDIFGLFLAEDEQKSKLVPAHPPEKRNIALHINWNLNKIPDKRYIAEQGGI